jgi:DNA-binding transcriptional regulator GbsR (MarR family)
LGIVKKEFVKGERKEYFVAEKDVWYLFKQITKERRKREIEPVISFLEELKNIEDKDSDEAKEFIKLMDDFSSVTGKINNIMDLAIKSDDHWLVGKITNLLK